MVVFETASPENTLPALKIAFDKASELSADVVLPSTSGATALKAMEFAKKIGFGGKIIVVSHAWGMRNPGENTMSDKDRKTLEDAGITVVTAAHALSGTERALSTGFSGTYPVETLANALRILCSGVKVCIEISAMAMDAGKLAYQRPVVAMGGTRDGVDTVCVLTPSYSAKILDARIHEILCKPY